MKHLKVINREYEIDTREVFYDISFDIDIYNEMRDVFSFTCDQYSNLEYNESVVADSDSGISYAVFRFVISGEDKKEVLDEIDNFVEAVYNRHKGFSVMKEKELQMYQIDVPNSWTTRGNNSIRIEYVRRDIYRLYPEVEVDGHKFMSILLTPYLRFIAPKFSPEMKNQIKRIVFDRLGKAAN